YLIDHLRGIASERATRFGHDRLSTFGIGADLSVRQWRSVIRQLIARGTLDNTVDEYGGLHLAADAAEVLHGRKTLHFRIERKPARQRKQRTSVPPRDIAPADEPLWEALRAERRRLAETQGVPAYVIFADATLRDMMARRPATRTEMLAVHGVGESKLERYGDTFLRVIAEADDQATPQDTGTI